MTVDVYKRSELSPSSDVATDDTMTFAYPSGTSQGDFVAGEERLWVEGLNNYLDQAADTFTVSYGGSNITVTYKDATTIPSGTRVVFEGKILDTDDLTDSSGGTVDGTVAAISGSGADSDINNNFADLSAKVNTLLQACRDRGIL